MVSGACPVPQISVDAHRYAHFCSLKVTRLWYVPGYLKMSGMLGGSITREILALRLTSIRQ